jgi:hypothetical protein
MTCHSSLQRGRQEQTGCCRSSLADEWRRSPKAALQQLPWRTAGLPRNLPFAGCVECVAALHARPQQERRNGAAAFERGELVLPTRSQALKVRCYAQGRISLHGRVLVPTTVSSRVSDRQQRERSVTAGLLTFDLPSPSAPSWGHRWSVHHHRAGDGNAPRVAMLGRFIPQTSLNK